MLAMLWKLLAAIGIWY